jgi:hypothetical protein
VETADVIGLLKIADRVLLIVVLAQIAISVETESVMPPVARHLVTAPSIAVLAVLMVFAEKTETKLLPTVLPIAH